MADQREEQSSFFAMVLKLADSFLDVAKKMAKPILELHCDTINNDGLEKLKRLRGRISVTIRDAEEMDVRDEYDKLWLGELRDLECMATDILEEFEYEELHRRCNARPDGSASEVIFSPPSYLHYMLDKMVERHQEVAFDRNALRLRPEDGTRRDLSAVVRPPTTSFHVGEFYGRDEEVKQVIRMLLLEKPGHCTYSVVPIVGMPGVGKTALVQYVYNHESVTSCFDLRVWVCASDACDATKISKAMVEEITEKPCGLTQLNVLQKSTGDLLAGKRFLIVLDDLPSLEHEQWEKLQVPFAKGAPGSKVIVTSGCIRIANIMPASDPYHLMFLPDDICWLICKSHLFGSLDDDIDPSSHHELRKAVIKKCGGLPLAAKALGCSLSSGENWRDLLENELCTDDEFVRLTLPAFRRIYDRLPAHLKRCFAYCSLFPRGGYTFEKHQVVRFWMAQGFVSDAVSGSRNIEVTGTKYFDDLVGRSIFQISACHEDGKEMYVMHDLFHELAELVAGDEFRRTDDYKLPKMHYKTRHFSLSPCEAHSEFIQLEAFDGQGLRSFLFLPRIQYKMHQVFFNIKIPEGIFTHLQCLRALDLKNTNIAKLPKSTALLKHLHYFCLHSARITSLPESLCCLYNLHTLDLRHCSRLQELPRRIKNLPNLVHLHLPSGMGKLNMKQIVC